MNIRIVVGVLAAVAAGGCADHGAPAPMEAEARPALAAAEAQQTTQFLARLSGAQEVPAVSTRARGEAIFTLSADGTQLHYKLFVSRIENVTMAHIHKAPAGSNGQVVVWLYPASGPPGQLIPGGFNGKLAEGVITAANLTGPLAGQSLRALVEVISLGNAYVNVHTRQRPSGEVRGQIQ